MSIQYKPFQGGKGFALHRVPHTTRHLLRYSAWYAEDGTLLGAELMGPWAGAKEVVKAHHVVWSYLQAVGERYVKR